MATQEIINIGATANDGSGDPLRVAFQKINNNFTELFDTTTSTSNSYSVGTTANQVIFETPANTFTQGTFTIRSDDAGTDDSQLVTIFAQKNNAGTTIKFTAYGTTFFGNAVTNYGMDITGGNVRLKVNPLVNGPLFHFISSQILFEGVGTPGVPLQLDGYVANSIMSTENVVEITTQE